MKQFIPPPANEGTTKANFKSRIIHKVLFKDTSIVALSLRLKYPLKTQIYRSYAIPCRNF